LADRDAQLEAPGLTVVEVEDVELDVELVDELDVDEPVFGMVQLFDTRMGSSVVRAKGLAT
jgi:hypothetical protein